MAQIYQDGTYLSNNPTWHETDSPLKAKYIDNIIRKNALEPRTICEIGCGAGEILNSLSNLNSDNREYFGYEISPQAFEICSKKTKSNLSFKLADLLEEDAAYFDVLLAIDVFEHVEDYFTFLRKLQGKARYKIFHIPLDLSVQTVLRSSPIIGWRKSVGHIHYFTKETALAALVDTGYSIIDHTYTAGSLERRNKGWKTRMLTIPRRLCYAMNKDLAVRVLGGYSLMVLAK